MRQRQGQLGPPLSAASRAGCDSPPPTTAYPGQRCAQPIVAWDSRQTEKARGQQAFEPLRNKKATSTRRLTSDEHTHTPGCTSVESLEPLEQTTTTLSQTTHRPRPGSTLHNGLNKVWKLRSERHEVRGFRTCSSANECRDRTSVETQLSQSVM